MEAAFRAALAHQGIIALAIFALLAAAVVSLRAWRSSAAVPGRAVTEPARRLLADPAGRRLLQIGFGNLWLFDGLLQAQPNMPAGLPSRVIDPVAASSPPWVQEVVGWAVTAWSYHPVQAAASAVWIEVGLGIWMLAARGTMSRLAGLAGAWWGLAVWVFGESFGGMLAPGQSWLTGAPGAALLYAAAGALVALPERAWRSPRPGRLTLAALGLFLAGMAVLQAWPGRGFWHGVSRDQMGSLAGMVQSMAFTPQPGFLAGWLSAFAAFDEAHGFAVNLCAVAVPAVTAAAFVSGRSRLVRPVLIGFGAVCLVDWVLVQDLSFLGGLGTDPGSMIPFILLATGGYLALTRPSPRAVPAPPAAAAPVTVAPVTAAFARAGWRPRAYPAALRERAARAGTWPVAALGGAGLVLLGVVAMALAQVSIE